MNNVFDNAANYIKENCQADDFTLYIYENDSIETRFAQNAITQHMAGKNYNVYLQVAFEGKTGSASVNQLDEETLQYVIETAEGIARFNQQDPEFVESEPFHQLPEVQNYAQATADLAVEDIVDNIAKCVENAKQKDAKVSGLTSRYISTSYMATKNGFVGYDQSTEFSHSMTMAREKVETKVSKSVKDFTAFDMDLEIAKINDQFDALGTPEQSEIGKYTVILRPAAVYGFFSFLLYSIDRRSADLGMTPFTDKIDQKIFGENFSFYSSIDDKELMTNKYSGEGLPTENTDWVRDGVLKNMHVSRFYGKEKDLKPTSFANFIIAGEDTTEEEMMKKAGKGLIINNFWYIRNVDSKRGEITGLTRDGVNYFEDGKIKHSVTNLRFNEIPQDVTKRILALGASNLIESGAKIPAMLIDDFNFEDVTTF